MFEPLDCIALRTVRYNDSKSILSVYTLQHGRVAAMLPAGASREARRLRAVCQPLQRFMCIADIRPNRDIHRIKDIKPHPLTSPATHSPVKSALALFIADFLSAILREPQQDPHLFNFIAYTVETLASTPAVKASNFHIAFLFRLQHFLGIEPDWATFSPGAVFDLTDGIFRQSPPLHNRFLPSSEAEAAHRLSRITFRTATLFTMSRADRNRVIDRLIQYYSIHFPGLGAVSSLDVLRSLFSF
jgi:DNA repair protein RecO (recombination protein O)